MVDSIIIVAVFQYFLKANMINGIETRKAYQALLEVIENKKKSNMIITIFIIFDVYALKSIDNLHNSIKSNTQTMVNKTSFAGVGAKMCKRGFRARNRKIMILYVLGILICARK